MKNEFRFWRTDEVTIKSLEQDILEAIEEMERYEGDVGIVNIHLDDHHGKYIPQILTCMLKGIEVDEYNSKYDSDVMSEEEILDFDELLEEVDEELNKLTNSYKIVPEGYEVSFGWWEGAICTLVYPIS